MFKLWHARVQGDPSEIPLTDDPAIARYDKIALGEYSDGTKGWEPAAGATPTTMKRRICFAILLHSTLGCPCEHASVGPLYACQEAEVLNGQANPSGKDWFNFLPNLPSDVPPIPITLLTGHE
jgi:hypothetical protein